MKIRLLYSTKYLLKYLLNYAKKKNLDVVNDKKKKIIRISILKYDLG